MSHRFWQPSTGTPPFEQRPHLGARDRRPPLGLKFSGALRAFWEVCPKQRNSRREYLRVRPMTGGNGFVLSSRARLAGWISPTPMLQTTLRVCPRPFLFRSLSMVALVAPFMARVQTQCATPPPPSAPRVSLSAPASSKLAEKRWHVLVPPRCPKYPRPPNRPPQ